MRSSLRSFQRTPRETPSHRPGIFSPEDVQAVIDLMREMGFDEGGEVTEPPRSAPEQKRSRKPFPTQQPEYVDMLEALKEAAKSRINDGCLRGERVRTFFPKESKQFLQRMQIAELIDIDHEADEEEQKKNQELIRILPRGERILPLLREAFRRKRLPNAPPTRPLEERVEACIARLMHDDCRERILAALMALSSQRQPDHAMPKAAFEKHFSGTVPQRVAMVLQLARAQLIVIVQGKDISAELKALRQAATTTSTSKKKVSAHVRLHLAENGGLGDVVLSVLAKRLHEEAARGTLKLNRRTWKRKVREIVKQVLDTRDMEGKERMRIRTVAIARGDSLLTSLPPQTDASMLNELKAMMAGCIDEAATQRPDESADDQDDVDGAGTDDFFAPDQEEIPPDEYAVLSEAFEVPTDD